MPNEDLVRGLTCLNKRCDHLIYLMETFHRKIDPFPGTTEDLSVLSVCKKCIIAVFMRNSTSDMIFDAAITDIWSPVDPAAAFFDKVFTVVVAGRA